jgi:hypothetical protein
MTAFDQAWALVKMPIYETPAPNIRFITGEPGEHHGGNKTDDVLGTYYPETPLTQIREMTPDEYLSRTPETSHPDLGGWYERKIREALDNDEEVRVGMPFVLVDPNITDPDHFDYRENTHDGRNRMAAMKRLGYGDSKFPVRYIEWPPMRSSKS